MPCQRLILTALVVRGEVSAAETKTGNEKGLTVAG